jgi:hypothetical protein
MLQEAFAKAYQWQQQQQQPDQQEDDVELQQGQDEAATKPGSSNQNTAVTACGHEQQGTPPVEP